MANKSTNNNHSDVTDLSNLVPDRKKVKLPDGNEYPVLAQGDLGPVVGAKLKDLSEKSQALQDSLDLESAQALEEMMREQACIVCPSMPKELSDGLTYQEAFGVFATFLTEVRDGGGMAPQIQEMVDALPDIQPTGTS